VPSVVSHSPTDNPRVYAFDINGSLTEVSVESLAAALNQAFDDNEDKIDVLLIFSSQIETKVDAASLLSVDVIKAKFRELYRVRRYVTVGAPPSVERASKALGVVFQLEVHTYPASALGDACKLLQAQRR